MTIGRLEKWKNEDGSEIVYYKRLLRLSPEKFALLDFLAEALYNQAEYREAIHCWKKLIKKHEVKSKFKFLMKIAQAYEALGEIEHAYHYYGEAMEAKPSNLTALGKYGQMAYMIENYEDALKAFKYLSKKESHNEIAWHNLGLTYYNMGFHEEAIDCLLLSVSVEDESADTWYTLATIYSENYLLDDALFALEKALSLDETLREAAAQEESFYSLSGSNLFRFLINY
jgi:protein O-GlcNAc transferase